MVTSSAAKRSRTSMAKGAARAAVDSVAQPAISRRAIINAFHFEDNDVAVRAVHSKIQSMSERAENGQSAKLCCTDLAGDTVQMLQVMQTYNTLMSIQMRMILYSFPPCPYRPLHRNAMLSPTANDKVCEHVGPQTCLTIKGAFGFVFPPVCFVIPFNVTHTDCAPLSIGNVCICLHMCCQ